MAKTFTDIDEANDKIADLNREIDDIQDELYSSEDRVDELEKELADAVIFGNDFEANIARAYQFIAEGDIDAAAWELKKALPSLDEFSHTKKIAEITKGR